MKNIIWFFLLLGIANGHSLHGQMYTISMSDNKWEFIASAALWTSIHAYDYLTPPELLDDFDDVDPGNIWSVERNSLSKNSRFADRLSDWSLYVSIASPFAAIVLDKKLNSQGWNIVQMCLQGYFLENGLNTFTKLATERPRPYVYQDGLNYLNRDVSKNSTKSFYSGHSSSSAYFAFFAAKIFHDMHPDSKWKYPVWGLAGAVAATTGIMRYQAGKHFISDVVVGWIAGAGFGILVPEIYKCRRLRIRPRAGGMSISLLF